MTCFDLLRAPSSVRSTWVCAIEHHRRVNDGVSIVSCWELVLCTEDGYAPYIQIESTVDDT